MFTIRLMLIPALLMLCFIPLNANAGNIAITRVSVSSDGAQGNADSTQALVSADGSLIAFQSTADNLVAGDLNNACGSATFVYHVETDNCADIFLRNVATGTTERLGIGMNGTPPDTHVGLGDMSSDGRFFAFSTRASNISNDDTDNGGPFPRIDGFVFDRQSSTAEKVNIGVNGEQNSYVYHIDLSDDGQRAVFITDSGLDPADTNSRSDAYLRDLASDTTTWISKPASGSNNPYVTSAAISGDGSRIVFRLYVGSVLDYVLGATDFIEGLILYEVESSTMQALQKPAGLTFSSPSGPALNQNGRYLVFSASGPCPGSVCPLPQVFRHDTQTDITEMVSSNEGMPGDGRSSLGYGNETAPGISDDGRFVAFESMSNNLVNADTYDCDNIYVRDMETAAPVLVSVGKAELPARGTSRLPAISGDGGTVVFESDARGLVDGDTNGLNDVFVTSDFAAATGLATAGIDEPQCHDVPTGDLDCSGTVTAQDAVELLRLFAGVQPFAECRHYSAVSSCFNEPGPWQAISILWRVIDESIFLGCGGK